MPRPAPQFGVGDRVLFRYPWTEKGKLIIGGIVRGMRWFSKMTGGWRYTVEFPVGDRTYQNEWDEPALKSPQEPLFPPHLAATRLEDFLVESAKKPKYQIGDQVSTAYGARVYSGPVLDIKRKHGHWRYLLTISGGDKAWVEENHVVPAQTGLMKHTPAQFHVNDIVQVRHHGNDRFRIIESAPTAEIYNGQEFPFWKYRLQEDGVAHPSNPFWAREDVLNLAEAEAEQGETVQANWLEKSRDMYRTDMTPVGRDRKRVEPENLEAFLKNTFLDISAGKKSKPLYLKGDAVVVLVGGKPYMGQVLDIRWNHGWQQNYYDVQYFVDNTGTGDIGTHQSWFRRWFPQGMVKPAQQQLFATEQKELLAMNKSAGRCGMCGTTLHGNGPCPRCKYAPTRKQFYGSRVILSKKQKAWWEQHTEWEKKNPSKKIKEITVHPDKTREEVYAHKVTVADIKNK